MCARGKRSDFQSEKEMNVATRKAGGATHAYYTVSMTTTTNILRQFSSKLLLHSSNSLSITRMEVKLGARV